jgi:hypothetical protein
VLIVGRCVGAERVSEQITGKWSEGGMRWEETEAVKLTLSGRINKFKVFRPVCVEKLTICLRLFATSNDNNWDVCGL